jgi:hypothetical protein
MLRDKTGNQLFRRVEVKIIFPNAIFPDKRFVQRAGPRQGFNATGIDEILMNIADQLDTLYPWWNFAATELTPVGRTIRFVFTFAGNRAVAPTAPVEIHEKPVQILSPSDPRALAAGE